jgi:hypothetical protein
MYEIKCYSEFKNGNLKLVKTENYTSYKESLKNGKIFVNNNRNNHAYIYRGIEESYREITGIHYIGSILSITNFEDNKWLE